MDQEFLAICVDKSMVDSFGRNELERTKPGTGLGLFLVRSVLKKMRGRITLADLPKHSGTRFDVQLPKASRWNPTETETLDTSERSPLSSTGNSRGINE